MSTSPASRNARASVGPPSSSSDWTPSAASVRSSSSSGPERSSSSEPSGSGPLPKASRLRLPLRVDVARVESRILEPYRPHPDRDRVGGRAQLVHEAARCLPRDPALARHGDAPVERHRRLVGDERAAERDPGSPGLVLAPRLEAVHELDLDALLAQALQPTLRLGIRDRASRRRRARSRPRAIASTQGGVVPWWAHGSIVTKSVAPRASSPAASSATISPCRPVSSVAPSPTTWPSATITAPTVGFG